MTLPALPTLAIHAEAWLQEELGAQRALVEALAKIEAAARAGASVELVQSGRALEEALSGAGGREARRATLLAKLGSALGLPARDVALSRLFARLAEEGLATARLEGLRDELRATTTAAVQASRRLAALAQYHRGFFEELCQLLRAGSPSDEGHLVDATG